MAGAYMPSRTRANAQTKVPWQNLKYLMQTVCLPREAQCADDEWLIMATAAAVHTGYRIIKAWGYVLIILLNSDEILKSFLLKAHITAR